MGPEASPVPRYPASARSSWPAALTRTLAHPQHAFTDPDQFSDGPFQEVPDGRPPSNQGRGKRRKVRIFHREHAVIGGELAPWRGEFGVGLIAEDDVPAVIQEQL